MWRIIGNETCNTSAILSAFTEGAVDKGRGVPPKDLYVS